MKTPLLLAATLFFSLEIKAYEVEFADQGLFSSPNYEKIDEYIGQNEKDIKILNLTHLLERQEQTYQSKISYLERELKKSNERIVSLSINSERNNELAQKKYAEENNFLKKEIIAKTKSVMEFQRQLEKIQPGKDVQRQIIQETLLAVEMRRTADQLAINNLLDSKKPSNTIEKTTKRMPASVDK